MKHTHLIPGKLYQILGHPSSGGDQYNTYIFYEAKIEIDDWEIARKENQKMLELKKNDVIVFLKLDNHIRNHDQSFYYRTMQVIYNRKVGWLQIPCDRLKDITPEKLP